MAAQAARQSSAARSAGVAAATELTARVTSLELMPAAEVITAWRDLFGSDPPTLPPRLLARAIAQQLQVAALGGPDRACVKQLDQLCTALAAGVQHGCSASAKPRASPPAGPGTQYLRSWGGRTHRVLVGEDGGYHYDGSAYRSLSAVAQRITGAHWSGPRFFGCAA